MKGTIVAEDINKQLQDELNENPGWRVAFAGMGINLALGILYTWSVISKRIPEDWGWNEDDKSLPYMFACLIFAIVMVPAGRMQDKIGPRIVATIGGILVGIGFIIASMTTSLLVSSIHGASLANAFPKIGAGTKMTSHCPTCLHA